MSTVIGAATTEHTDVLQLLRTQVRGEVSDTPARRAQYTSDASNYRVPPRFVVLPVDVDDLAAVTEISRVSGVPLTMRGGGTSVAGNAIGPGIVVDTSRWMHRVLEVDAEARTARVEPGTLMSTLQRAAAPHGLRFGPDPSTQHRATIGGMIGNNACGPRAIAYGRTADNVVALDVIDGMGRRYAAGRGLDPVPGLTAFVEANLATIRRELGRLDRQVSGYSLEHLLPERGADLAKALAGTEGTVATILEATVALVPTPQALALVALGYPDMASAADAVPALLPHRPLAVEGLDARLVDVVRRHRGASAVPELPPGGGWLLIEVGGPSRLDAQLAAERLVDDAGTPHFRVLPDGPEAAALWAIRADGAGLAGRTPAGRQAWPGWEDAAVPPERLGAYLREFEALMTQHGVAGLPYGHFGDGCIHVRIDLPLDADGSALRAFVTDAAELAVAHGGSLSGEHGDGRARSELLRRMYSEQAIAAFEGFKHLFDPRNLLNPGIIVAPRAIDADLRRPQALPLLRKSGFAFADDGGDFTNAVHRCVGVGKCRADSTDAGGFMCPSYLATRDENDVTRGRARVLQEMINGTVVTGGWDSPEVHGALDLCLSCKACSRDCPAGVDMAQYKAEVLHRTYEGRIRPISHYVLGWLPRWAKLASAAPRLVNSVLGMPGLARILLPLGGMDGRRQIPKFARRPFRAQRPQAAGRRVAASPSALDDGRPAVVLWVDSFSSSFSPEAAAAAIRVLRDTGCVVLLPEQDACCGLTWISTGQLTAAKARLAKLLDVFAPYAEAGIPIIGLEPSCTAVLRSDLLDLLSDDPRSALVAGATKTLAEQLADAVAAGWSPPDLRGVTAIVQPHCHQYSVMGFAADTRLLRDAGAELQVLAGCCGLAGNFGMERGHYEISVQVAEHALLPALRDADPATVYLADGFSCRTQAEQLAGVTGTTLAQLLASRLTSRASAPYPE